MPIADDDLPRCPWGIEPPEYREYHDQEWGRPVADEIRVFEKVCLEGFQSGLSWLTILRKRPNFRRAFAGFEPEKVARFGAKHVDRLLGDAGIIRHRGKIEATINNAQATLALHDRGDSLAALLWRFEPARHKAPREMGEVAATTPESEALSKELRRLGFKFVGPTTMFAAMQALGVVNDHFAGCHVRAASEADRAAFTPPS